MTRNETALFNSLGHIIELSEQDCNDYNTLWNNLQAKMPQELQTQLTQVSKKEFLGIFSGLLAEISIKFDVPHLKIPHATTTVNILGYELELSETDCATFEDKYNAIYDNAPAPLIEKLDALSDDELIQILTQPSN